MKPVAAATVGNSALKPISRPVSVSSGVATPIARQPEKKEHAPPRELDGRTQLVALAPQDGTVFFDQLREKYQNVAGELPQAALVAQQENIDYLKLINDACNKDCLLYTSPSPRDA